VGYRLTQGLHVITGLVTIPLLLLKLWTVYPLFWVWPPAPTLLRAIERLTLGALVASSLFELLTGFLNILGWYPWHFVSSRPTSGSRGWWRARSSCTSP